ncbi:hypothetical protein C0Q70_00046 [Pomacea canaliculata]|uniref:Uncharacterized protein n=1 Tax=Pomacea canaliculata TaxID=400727 RepID=A0A2T7PVJ8_POMCA|nr:hypothetical protein C0Q70_00046 [Pomacea canaliculata]
MTTSDCDVTFFLASDGREWGDYCQSVVGSFPEIAYTVLEVDKHDLDKLPDVTSACSRSPVWVLLATSQLLRCVRETWFSSLLTSPAAASTVVVVTIDDERNVRDVFSSPHVTSRWTVLDCGQREDELRKMMAALLNIIENSQRRQGKADVALQLYPENIREPGTSIAIVFSQEVTSEVKVVVGSSQACPVSRLNSCVLTFTAPVMPPGTYDVSVMVGSHTLHCALTYLPADQRAFDSCHFLRQCVAMTDPRPLDLFLAHAVRLCQQQSGGEQRVNCQQDNAAGLALDNDFKELAATISKERSGACSHRKWVSLSPAGEPEDTVNPGYVSLSSPVLDSTARGLHTRPQFGSVPDMSVLPALDPRWRPQGGYRSPAGVMTTSPPEVPRQRLYQPNRRTHSALSKTRSVEEDMYVSPLCGPLTTRLSSGKFAVATGIYVPASLSLCKLGSRAQPRGTFRKKFTIELLSFLLPVLAIASGIPASLKGQATPASAEGRETVGSAHVTTKAQELHLKTYHGSPRYVTVDSAKDRATVGSAKDRVTVGSAHVTSKSQDRRLKTYPVTVGSAKEHNRMSYADKFLQQAPIPPPRRRKKKMVETTKL